MPQSEAQFESLFMEHSDRVLAYSARRTRTSADAADVLADTYLAAWRRIDDAPEDGSELLWLYGIARRVVANQRRGDRRRSLLATEVAGHVVDVADAASRHVDTVDAKAVRSALESLQDNDRELLLLIGWEGLKPAEAAIVLGCGRAALRTRLHRARRRFDTALQAAGVQRRQTIEQGPQRWLPTHSDAEEAR